MKDLTENINELIKLDREIIKSKDTEISNLRDLVKKYEQLVALQDKKILVLEMQLQLWRPSYLWQQKK